MDNNTPNQTKKNLKEYKLQNGYTIIVDRDACIGAATCVAASEKTFQLDSENKAVVLDSANNETIQNIIEAAKSCPVSAIIIKDPQGKQIFP